MVPDVRYCWVWAAQTPTTMETRWSLAWPYLQQEFRRLGSLQDLITLFDVVHRELPPVMSENHDS